METAVRMKQSFSRGCAGKDVHDHGLLVQYTNKKLALVYCCNSSCFLSFAVGRGVVQSQQLVSQWVWQCSGGARTSGDGTDEWEPYLSDSGRLANSELRQRLGEVQSTVL